MADLNQAWVVWERKVEWPRTWVPINSFGDDIHAMDWVKKWSAKRPAYEYVILHQGEHPRRVPEQR